MADLQPLTLASAGQPGILPDKTVNPWQVLRGSNLGQEGAGLQDVAQKGDVMLNNYNEGVVNSRLPALQQTYMAQRDRAQTLQGQNVLKAGTDESGNPLTYSQSALKAFDDAATEQQAQLTNGSQQKSFQQQAARMRGDLEVFANAHQNVQLHNASIEGTAAAAQGFSDQMVQAQLQGDHAAFGNAYSNLEDKIAQTAALKGLDPDSAKQDRQNILSATYSQVINGMLTSNHPGAYRDAQDFFNGVKDDMNPAAQAKARNLIEAYTIPQQGLEVAQAAWQAHPAPAGTDPRYYTPPIADMAKAINAQDLDPKVKEHAIAQVHQLYEFQKEQSEGLVKTVEGNAFKSLLDKHMPISVIMQSPDVVAMPGTAREILQTNLEAFTKRNQNTPEDQAAKFASYWAYSSDPASLVKKSDAQITALVPAVGLPGVQDLLQQKQKLLNGGGGKVLASNVDVDQLKVFANQAGIPAYDKSQEATTAPVMGQLKHQVDAQIETDQQAKGRELTRAEKDDIIKRNLVTYTIQNGDQRSWYNPAGWFGASTVPAPRLAFQLQPGDQLVVPDDQRKAIVAEAQANGVTNPTEQQIQSRYFQMQQPAAGAQPQLVQRPVVPKSLKVK